MLCLDLDGFFRGGNELVELHDAIGLYLNLVVFGGHYLGKLPIDVPIGHVQFKGNCKEYSGNGDK